MIVGGIDEVGWGAWSGPIISVVAVFRPSGLSRLPSGVKDSKKLTEAQRGGLYLLLCDAVDGLGVGHAWPWEIDALSPTVALQLSYTRALAELKEPPERLIVDGSNPVRSWPQDSQIVEPRADSRYLEVSAASVIAKHFRDRIMIDLAARRRREGLPDYNWAKNKGYGSEDHRKAILVNGLLCVGGQLATYAHRKSYCRKFLGGG
jgi:ribonuclease HII